MAKSKKSSKSTSVTVSAAMKDPALSVMCPRCSVFPGKMCVHTKGKSKGNKCLPHEERIRLSKVQVSTETAAKIASIGKSSTVPVFEKPDPKAKLTAEQKNVVDLIIEKIEAQGKHATFVSPVTVGPIISTYRFFPLKKTKVAHIEAMSKDFAVALGSETIVVKRMPGESAIGVFVPNKIKTIVEYEQTLPNVAQYMAEPTKDGHKKIPINLGITSNGDPFVDDLTQQPHMLIAGTTMGGKSTLLHGVVTTMANSLTRDELQLIISDTKGVEFADFTTLPHLRNGEKSICKNWADTVMELDWACKESESRLSQFATFPGVKNIHQYNARAAKTPGMRNMCYVVIVIDELADLIGPARDRSEAKLNSDKLSTLASRSRAAGIHIIASTQRPDVKLIKGQIKANLPTRLSFRLPSSQDSRTILNTKGAENLISQGDMFYTSSTSPELKRLHAPLITSDEIAKVLASVLLRHQEAQKVKDQVYEEMEERKAIQEADDVKPSAFLSSYRQ